MDPEFWPFIEAHVRTLLPTAQLWPGITTDKARYYHREACRRVEIADYRMNDGRHSYAVRKMRQGIDPYLIAMNLGHKDATMVHKVYGKYRPRAEDRRRLVEGGR